jgi:hypothetical protein
MNKKAFLFLTLFIGVAGGVVIANYSNSTNSTSELPANTTKSSDEVTTTTTRPTAPGRSVKGLQLDKSTNVQPELVAADQAVDSGAREQLEQRFRSFREDGRKQFEDLVGGDREKMGRLFRSSFANPEFQQIFQSSREISEKWRTASDGEKPALMDQLSALRNKGLGIAKQELAKMDAPPAAPVLPTVTVDGATIAPAAPKPAGEQPAAPAPAPVIIM